MTRFILALLFAAALCSPAAAELYRLEGMLTGGTTLFTPVDPNVPFEQYGAPEGGFPAPYVGRLGLGPGKDDWTFEFTGFDAGGGERHEIGDPAGDPAVMDNEVVRTGSNLSIEFRDHSLLFEHFELNADLAAGTGAWQWNQGCLVCDLAYPLPSATATITSVTLVPEPESLLIIFVMGGFLWPIARRGQRPKPIAPPKLVTSGCA